MDITATAWRVESRTRASNMFSIVAAILTLLALAAPLFISRGAVQNLSFILTSKRERLSCLKIMLNRILV